uniref:Uncharacterized protein n=1 Tax=Anabas testudineus TaxID=64144 RepID=A0A7N6A6F9_ANATE
LYFMWTTPHNSCKGSTASPKPRIWILRVCLCHLVPACLSVSWLGSVRPPPLLFSPIFCQLSWHPSVIAVGSAVLWSSCPLPGHSLIKK